MVQTPIESLTNRPRPEAGNTNWVCLGQFWEVVHFRIPSLVDRFQSFSLVIRHVISAQLSARLGSVTLGRRRRSLDSDLDISTHRSEISGKVARPFSFFEEGSSAPGAAAEVPR